MIRTLILIVAGALLSTLVLSQGDFQSEGLESDNLVELINKVNALDDDHCEVPCGIYGDSLRISLIKEHVMTIEKAMNQINKESDADKPNYNQLIRWVNNKEKHAEEVQHIVAQYFLHQRIKMPKEGLGTKEAVKASSKYHGLLSALHAIQVYAMKCKQSTDLNQVGKINTAIADFEGLYFHSHDHDHKHGHKH